MATGRDSSFMIRNTSFTKQVHFYICKIQIKPKLYPLSRGRNIVHHKADTASIGPAHAKLTDARDLTRTQTYSIGMCTIEASLVKQDALPAI